MARRGAGHHGPTPAREPAGPPGRPSGPHRDWPHVSPPIAGTSSHVGAAHPTGRPERPLDATDDGAPRPLPLVAVELMEGTGALLPARATAGAAGYDICAREAVTLAPGAFGKVGTGLKLAIPAGYEAQVRPRSGLAAKHGVTVLNAPGTIDSDYRGEVCVVLINHGREPFAIEPGMRIAQLIFAPVTTVGFRDVPALETSARGSGGFGSTGR